MKNKTPKTWNQTAREENRATAQNGNPGGFYVARKDGGKIREEKGCFWEGTAEKLCGHCYECREHYR